MIVIASDHAGFALKQELMEHLRRIGQEFEDVGTFSAESCHYPEFAEKAARGVADGTYEKGILICGTGLGMSMAANALGGRVIGPELAKRMVDIFLNTEFLGGKHAVRVDMIRALEER